MDYAAYFFDFDYTLAFSEPGILACFKHTFAVFGVQADDEAIIKTIGIPLVDALAQLSGFSGDIIEQMHAEYKRHADAVMTKLTRFYPEAVTLLGVLKERGKKVAVISNKITRRIYEALDRDSLTDKVSLVLGIDDLPSPKPAPDGIQKAAALLGVGRQEILYIGDNLVDAKTAQNAGVDFAAVTTGTTTQAEFAALPHVKICDTLAALLD